MDATRLGAFIAERRKELNLTQAELAQRLYVTDKAVSRWERGVGLPDIGNVEPLADALQVSLTELMRAERGEPSAMSAAEAEQLLRDAVRLSQGGKVQRGVGVVLLSLLVLAALAVTCLLLSDWQVLLFPVGGILTGLAAWAVPVWQMTLARRSHTAPCAAVSFSFALASLLVRVLSIAHEIHTGDMAAVLDTIDALAAGAAAFAASVVLLNVLMLWVIRKRQDGN